AFDLADDRDGAFLDPACQLFGHAGLGFTLADGGVHAVLLPAVAATASHLRRRWWPDATPRPAAAPSVRAAGVESSLQFDLAQRRGRPAPAPGRDCARRSGSRCAGAAGRTRRTARG